MTSPARRHYQQVSAALAAAAAAPGESMEGAGPYDLMLAKLHQDKHRLKLVQSIERKADTKREILPDYADYVAGVLAGGRGAQDDVLLAVMIWRLDAGDYPGCLDIADYALANNWKMPDQFSRTLATVVAEDFAEAALVVLKAEQFDPQLLQRVAALTDQHDMPDQVRAKLYKAIGYALQAAPAEALPYLERALQLFDRIGVKKDIERLQKQLGNPAGGDPAGT
jgi:hypothetical protein